MLYQRKQEVIGNLKDSQNQNNNNDKRVITTTTIEKITTQNKPIISITKPSIFSSTSTVIEKKEIQNEKIITETSLSKSEIESSSSIDKKPSRFRVYLSSRYRGSKKNSVSSEDKDKIISGQDIQNNIYTLNVRKSPDNITQRNIVETKNETKKINYSYNNNITNFANSINDKKTSTSINKEKEVNKSFTKEKIVLSPNNKRFRQVMEPQNIISPIKHYDDGNSLYDNKSSSEKKSKITKVTNYNITNSNTKTSKTINLNTNIKTDNIKYNISNSNYKEGTKSTINDNRSQNKSFDDKQKTSYYNRRSNLNTSSNSSNIVSYKEVKNIVKKFSKVYDPFRNQKGLLIKKTQITLPGASDEVFNNRGRVLSKMNKLSNILLAKKKKFEEENIYLRNNSKNRSKNQDSKSKSKNKKDKKLLLFSLTMISSKGLNNKDTIILRSMRNEKGGVVDLAQDKNKKEKFKIKKAVKVAGGEKKFKVPFKEKEKAAKIIQAWWKELKDIYNYKLSQIIKIQSIWKGGWVRRNIYDLLYLNYLYLSFCQKIEKVLTNKMTKVAFDKLKMKLNTINETTNDKKTQKNKNENVSIYTSTYTKTTTNDKTTTNTNTNNNSNVKTYISSSTYTNKKTTTNTNANNNSNIKTYISTSTNENNKPTTNTNTNNNSNIKTYISTSTYTNKKTTTNTNANNNSNIKTYISTSTNVNNKPNINTDTNTNNKTYISTSTNANNKPTINTNTNTNSKT